MNIAETILVPTDLSEGAAAALDYAVQIAGNLDATIHMVNAVGVHLISSEYGMTLTPDLVSMILESNRAALNRMVGERSDKAVFGPALVKVGEPREVIVQVAAELAADLIVMGSHGRRGFRRMVLGSVAESIARTAPCPVLLVREKASERS